VLGQTRLEVLPIAVAGDQDISLVPPVVDVPPEEELLPQAAIEPPRTITAPSLLIRFMFVPLRYR